jgi:hypothetical protein
MFTELPGRLMTAMGNEGPEQHALLSSKII